MIIPTVNSPCIARNTPGYQHRRATDRVYKARQKSKKLIHALKTHRIGVDARLIAGPFLKKAVLGTACLYGLDHFNPGDSRTGKLAGVTHLYARDIDTFFLNILEMTRFASTEKSPIHVRKTLYRSITTK